MIIQNKYKILDLIGQGAFGSVFKGEKIKNNELIAIKINHTEYNILKHEAAILNFLQNKKCINIPQVFYYGFIHNKYILVIPYYNYSIEEFLNLHNNNKIARNLFFQGLKTLENIHVFGIIHRDIKPQNIRIHNNKFMLIDFGLSTFYNDENGFITNTEQTTIIGSPMYISNFVHSGNVPSIRDDIISLCYVFIKITLGELPWDIPENLPIEISDQINIDIANDKLCLIDFLKFKELPILTETLKHLLTLDYDETVNYSVLITHLLNL